MKCAHYSEEKLFVAMSPEDQTFSKFIRFSDIPNDEYAVSKDKCFREKDSFLSNLISF